MLGINPIAMVEPTSGKDRKAEKMSMEGSAKIYVRCDGNAVIGAGHIMRCLTITDCMSSETEVTYLCADELSAKLVESRGCKVIVLGTDGTGLDTELPVLATLFRDTEEQRTILVDSYYVTKTYLAALRSYGRVIYMDDLCEDTFPVDGIINYNAFAEEEEYRKRYPNIPCFVGASYVPLRPQFSVKEQEMAVQQTPQKKEMHILLTTGGGDQENIAGAILEKVDPLCREYEEKHLCRVVLHVVAGQFSPNYERLQAYAADHTGVLIHSNVQNMGELMRSCQLGITAGGTTIYEMFASHLPVICFAYAKNQEALVRYVGEQKAGFSAGNYHEAPKQTLQKLVAYVKEAMAQPGECTGRAQTAATLVDGLGAERLARAIECF